MVDSKAWRTLARQAHEIARRLDSDAPEHVLLIEIAARYLMLACMADEELVQREQIVFPSGIM
jgi:hypothetical protein